MQSLADKLIGRTLYDVERHKVGRIHELYIDEHNRTPTWLAVATGWLGSREAFVPYGLTHLGSEMITVDARKDDIKHAPHVKSHAKLTPDEQRSLGNYYKAVLERWHGRASSRHHYAY